MGNYDSALGGCACPCTFDGCSVDADEILRRNSEHHEPVELHRWLLGRPPKSGTSASCSTRARARRTSRPRCRAPRTSTPALAAAAAAFPGWRDATPSERSLALFRIADAIEARAEELVAVESANTGKPLAVTLAEEIPPDGRPDPLLRRGRPPPRGQVGRRVHGRPHLDDPARAHRRLRRGHPVELPGHDGRLEVGAGHRRRQRHGAQAVRHHAGLDPADGRDHGRAPARRRVQRGLRRP